MTKNTPPAVLCPAKSWDKIPPKPWMKNNEKLGLCLMDENHFISLLFTPLGETEASICCVIKAEA
jgi:hypothetical protein